MQFSELKEMKSVKSDNSIKHKYEKVSTQDDKSEIVIFQSNRKISVSFFTPPFLIKSKISFADSEKKNHTTIVIKRLKSSTMALSII